MHMKMHGILIRLDECYRSVPKRQLVYIAFHMQFFADISTEKKMLTQQNVSYISFYNFSIDMYTEFGTKTFENKKCVPFPDRFFDHQCVQIVL